MKIIAAIFSLSLIINIVCLINMAIHCNAGFWGYPDVWDSEAHEKFHYIAMPISFIVTMLSGILLCILKCKGGGL